MNVASSIKRELKMRENREGITEYEAMERIIGEVGTSFLEARNNIYLFMMRDGSVLKATWLGATLKYVPYKPGTFRV